MLALFYTLIYCLLSVTYIVLKKSSIEATSLFILLAPSRSDAVRTNWPGYFMGLSGVRTKLHSSVLDAW